MVRGAAATLCDYGNTVGQASVVTNDNGIDIPLERITAAARLLSESPALNAAESPLTLEPSE